MAKKKQAEDALTTTAQAIGSTLGKLAVKVGMVTAAPAKRKAAVKKRVTKKKAAVKKAK